MYFFTSWHRNVPTRVGFDRLADRCVNTRVFWGVWRSLFVHTRLFAEPGSSLGRHPVCGAWRVRVTLPGSSVAPGAQPWAPSWSPIPGPGPLFPTVPGHLEPGAARGRSPSVCGTLGFGTGKCPPQEVGRDARAARGRGTKGPLARRGLGAASPELLSPEPKISTGMWCVPSLLGPSCSSELRLNCKALLKGKRAAQRGGAGRMVKLALSPLVRRGLAHAPPLTREEFGGCSLSLNTGRFS